MRLIIAVTCFLLSHWAFSYDRIEGVYEAHVEINDRSDASRNTAIKQGLEQVLIRYTGYSNITRIPGVEAELNNAAGYVICLLYTSPSPRDS